MRFAPIVPVEYDPGSFTDYHLILAHEVLEDEATRAYYQSLQENGHTIILDNSVIELGEAVGLDLLEKAWKYFPDSYLALPDRLRDATATVKFAEEWLSRHRENNRLMIVPQGSDPNEWLACLDVLVNTLSPHTRELVVGIPRLTEDWKGGRYYLYTKAVEDGIWWGPFHLLGIQHNLEETYWALAHRSVLGVDSSLPGRAALLGVPSDEVTDLRKIPDLIKYDATIHDKVQREIEFVVDRLAGVARV